MSRAEEKSMPSRATNVVYLILVVATAACAGAPARGLHATPPGVGFAAVVSASQSDEPGGRNRALEEGQPRGGSSRCLAGPCSRGARRASLRARPRRTRRRPP